jgi:hypothetical protein
MVVHYTSCVDAVLYGAYFGIRARNLVPSGLPVQGYGGHGHRCILRVLCLLFCKNGEFARQHMGYDHSFPILLHQQLPNQTDIVSAVGAFTIG